MLRKMSGKPAIPLYRNIAKTMVFTRKELEQPKRICLCLREARERSGVPLETVAKKTRMSARYLLALEECRWGDLPFSRAYQKHLIKAYAQAIGADSTPYISQFEDEELWHEKKRAPAPVVPKHFSRFLSLPLVLRAISTGALSLLLVGYLGFQVKRIVDPPTLLIYSPADGDIVRTGTLAVSGKTEREVKVTLNGAPVSQNERGEFTAMLDLETGVNTLVFSAKKKHGKTTTHVRNVIVREQSQFSFTDAASRESAL